MSRSGAALATILFVSTPVAAWTPNGSAVCTASGNQRSACIVTDDQRGAIILWVDHRNGNADLYAQRLNASGDPLWAPDGVPVCTLPQIQEFPVVIADGSGGFIAAWEDHRGAQLAVYAQRFDAGGQALWTSDGIPVCPGSAQQTRPRIATDGAGGSIVAFSDSRNAGDPCAQRLDANGSLLWGPAGIDLSDHAAFEHSARVVSDAMGSAIVVWSRQDNMANEQLWGNRLNAAGATLWGAGVPLSSVARISLADVQSDGVGGALVAWGQGPTGDPDIYAQRVTRTGVAMWGASGFPVAVAPNIQGVAQLVSDGAGGAIVAWPDVRNGTSYELYASRLSSAGLQLWTQNLSVADAPEQITATIVSDAAGGAILTYVNNVDGALNIRAKRVDQSGALRWTVTVCSATGNQQDPFAVPDGDGGIIATWIDPRSGNQDVYAQRLEGMHGAPGRGEPLIMSVEDVTPDQGGLVEIEFAHSDGDRPGITYIDTYSIWRATSLTAATAGIAAMQGSWELLGNVPAQQIPLYTFLAPTTVDVTPTDPALHYFHVKAHHTPLGEVWTSLPAVGASLDNLAPAEPHGLLAARAAGNGVDLRWSANSEVDLEDYAVYRSTTPGVVPDALHFQFATTDTVAHDAGVPAGALYYVVVARDVHGNSSGVSAEVSVPPLATDIGAGNEMAGLFAISPNPFSTSARIAFTADHEPVLLEILDVSGRSVYEKQLSRLGAGKHYFEFDGRDHSGARLANGVYFCRLTTSGVTRTRSLTLLR